MAVGLTRVENPSSLFCQSKHNRVMTGQILRPDHFRTVFKGWPDKGGCPGMPQDLGDMSSVPICVVSVSEIDRTVASSDVTTWVLVLRSVIRFKLQAAGIAPRGRSLDCG